MVRQRNARRGRVGKDTISNVRVVDKDEGTDDVICQRHLQAYTISEGQIRVVCGYRQEISVGSTAVTGLFDWSAVVGSDDFQSFAGQYQEFRVRSIRFDIYDLSAGIAAPVNFWATYHQVGGTVPQTFDDVVDRSDSRAIAPGSGTSSLAWVAHSIPEMAFQSVSTYNGLGGLVYYVGSGTASAGRYSVIAKYVVDFRGRR